MRLVVLGTFNASLILGRSPMGLGRAWEVGAGGVMVVMSTTGNLFTKPYMSSGKL
jgi:hypothetical protein